MKIITTSDGSSSLYNEVLDETYHSSHGAIQEALHVFIANGLHYFDNSLNEISILEVGFGTGLNTLLTLLHSNGKLVDYTALETFPLSNEITTQLNYTSLLQQNEVKPLFEKLHNCNWNEKVEITQQFYLSKLKKEVQTIEFKNQFDLVYYDAFGPRAQPDMWTKEIFEKLYSALKPNGILVTYCAKGEVKRMLKAVGFIVETLPGPPGKREMTRAIKQV
ncbi:MAG: tRNA (5-methylaminomethyl-2-thiouridine)(34)-methyltransferase MnmD [Bacteroidota bacterium]